MPRCSRISLILLVNAIKIPSFSSIDIFLLSIMQNNVSDKKDLQFLSAIFKEQKKSTDLMKE